MTVVRKRLPKMMPVLRTFAMRLEGDSESVDELVGETLLRAIEKEHQYRPGTNLPAWCWTIMKNIKRDMYRKDLRRRQIPIDSLPEDAQPLEGDYDDGIGGDLFQALSMIPEKFKVLLELYAIHGLNYREIAETVGVPIGTVMSGMSRGRKHVKKVLSQMGILSKYEGKEDDSSSKRKE